MAALQTDMYIAKPDRSPESRPRGADVSAVPIFMAGLSAHRRGTSRENGTPSQICLLIGSMLVTGAHGLHISKNHLPHCKVFRCSVRLNTLVGFDRVFITAARRRTAIPIPQRLVARDLEARLGLGRARVGRWNQCSRWLTNTTSFLITSCVCRIENRTNIPA